MAGITSKILALTRVKINKITVERSPSEADWTTSEFYFNDIQKGVGIEDEKRNVKLKGETRIPNGTYDLKLRYSPKFSKSFYRDDDGNIIEAKKRNTEELKEKYNTSHELIWVVDVPGFQYILWHWGNTDDDTSGCYIVGSYSGWIGDQKAVLHSKKKYKEIYPLMWREIMLRDKYNLDKLEVEYKDK